MKTLKFLKLPLLLSIFIILASASPDGSRQTERIHRASNVLKSFDGMKDRIPHELLQDYNGIVVIPRMLNASFALGGMRGKGIAMVKLDNGKWSDPVFVTLTGGSFGFQFGLQSIDLVLVFRHKGALSKVKNGDVTIGGDVSATAGLFLGRNGTASTDYKLEAEVYSYSRSRGLFAGISIHGSDLSIDKKSNAEFYGDGMSSQDIFATDKSTAESVNMLKQTLAAL